MSVDHAGQRARATNVPVYKEYIPIQKQRRLVYNLLVVLVVATGSLALLVELDLVGDSLLPLGSGELVGLSLERLLLPLANVLLGRLELWVLSDLLVCARVDLLDIGRSNVGSEVRSELLLESLVILLLQRLHVLGDVSTDNVLLQDIRVEGLGLWVETGESLAVVGDEDTTVGGTLEGTEDSGSGGCSSETDIEVGLERSGLIVTDWDCQ